MMLDPEMAWSDWKRDAGLLLLENGYAREVVALMDWESWRDFWRDGYSPRDAVVEELVAGL